MEVLKYARDDFLTFCMAIDVPEADFALRKNQIFNQLNDNRLQRQLIKRLLLEKAGPPALLNRLYVYREHHHSQAHNPRYNRALEGIQKFYKMFF